MWEIKQIKSEEANKFFFFKKTSKNIIYLRGGLCQTHDGLSLRCGGYCAHLQVVGLQLRDRGKEGRAGQRGSREMGR